MLCYRYLPFTLSLRYCSSWAGLCSTETPLTSAIHHRTSAVASVLSPPLASDEHTQTAEHPCKGCSHAAAVELYAAELARMCLSSISGLETPSPPIPISSTTADLEEIRVCIVVLGVPPVKLARSRWSSSSHPQVVAELAAPARTSRVELTLLPAGGARAHG